jgi:hypothetical protein
MWGSSIYLQLDLLQVKVRMIVNRDSITGQLESSDPNHNMVVHEERISPQTCFLLVGLPKKPRILIRSCYAQLSHTSITNDEETTIKCYKVGYCTVSGHPGLPRGPRACRPKHSLEESISRWRCWSPLPGLGNDSIMGSLSRLIHSVPCCFDLIIDYFVSHGHGHILPGVQASICALYKT